MAEIDLSSEQFLDLAAEILNQGSSLRFRARGVSMRPIIQDGDLLEIRPLDWGQIRRGDILLFRASPRQSLVHRVVGIQRVAGAARFLLQGDAVLQPDGWIDPMQVLGRVERIERERMSTSGGEGFKGLKVERLEGLKVEEQGHDKQVRVIEFNAWSQRLLAWNLAWVLPAYKKVYRGMKGLGKK